MQRPSRQMSNRTSGSELDWGIILTLLLFMIIGLSAIFQAVLHSQYGTMQSALRATIVQGIFWILGTIIIAFLLRFDASQLWRLAPVAYGLGVFLLAAVLVLYDRNMAASTGAKSWFVLGHTSKPFVAVVRRSWSLRSRMMSIKRR